MVDFFTHDHVFIGYVDRMCQSFISGCVFLPAIVFDIVVVDFDLSLPVGDKFF